MKGKYINLHLLEIAGLRSALMALRLPYGKECRSITNFSYKLDGLTLISHAECYINGQDIELMQKLAKAGDEHAKVLRGVIVWIEIDAPRYFWQEMDTYCVGTDRLSSESTMHIQCKGLNLEELLAVKAGLPEGTMQKRAQMFSYQTLRRIYKQRRHHRLPHWHELCDFIEKLPFAQELIIADL